LLSRAAMGLSQSFHERFKPLIEILLVFLNGPGRANQLDVIGVLVAVDLQREHPVAGPVSRLVRSRHAVTESAADIKVRRGEPADLRLLDSRDVIDGLALRRDKLPFPAVDILLDRPTESLEEDQLGVRIVALGARHTELSVTEVALGFFF